MDTLKDSAPLAHPSTEERPCCCIGGMVYIGHVVEVDGEEVGAYTAYPYRSCQPVQNA